MHADTSERESYCAGKYRVIERLEPGGMARVYKVKDAADRVLALKLPSNADAEFASLAFNRECEALNALNHPNIVRLIDFGKTEDQDSYLALEWLPGCLAEQIGRNKIWEWEEFYADVGSPMLSALVQAHTRGIAHRDIKPENIRFDDLGTLKVTDFGIAKARSGIGIGKTFKQAGSPPFTPPESDDGTYSFSRDVFSWAAIAVTCLAGKRGSNLHELLALLESLPSTTTPAVLLKTCLSLDPGSRPVNAADLQAQTDLFHMKVTEERPIAIMLQIGQKELAELAQRFGSRSASECVQLLERDLNGCLHAYVADDEERIVRLIGVSADVSCKAMERGESFRVTSVREVNLERAESERRQANAVTGVFVRVVGPYEDLRDAANQRAFLLRLTSEQRRRDIEVERSKREHWLDCWSAFLREKDRVRRENRLRLQFSGLRQAGQNFVVTCEGEIDPETIPESLVYRPAGGRLIVFDIVRVFGDEITLRPLNMAPDVRLPANGELESNQHAQEQPIARQRAALENIRRDRAVSPHLKELLCVPAEARTPDSGALPPTDAGTFEGEKQALLDRALGVSSFLLVEGPPGTGKTTFIAELIRVYLKLFPERRVLLSSQTHTALDHVIAKLREKGMDEAIVRIHGDRIEKIDQAALPLTLERKTKSWIERVEERARAYIAANAKSSGLDARELEIAVLGEERHILLLDIDQRKSALDRLHDKIEIASKNAAEDEDLGRTSTLIDERQIAEESLRTLRDRLRRLEERLKGYGDFGVELAQSTADSSKEWIDALSKSHVPGAAQLKEQIQLQLDWFKRLGASRDFHPAVLGEARVVAGTCVGLGNVQAVGDQEFDLCVIDEVSKAAATETLIPMSRAKAWVLVGDPKQLPPYFESETQKSVDGFSPDELQATLLDYLTPRLPRECRAALTEQRRMSPGIGRLISEVFYGGTLKNLRSSADRDPIVAKVHPFEVEWHSTSSSPSRFEQEMPGKTFRNLAEAEIVQGILSKLDTANKGRTPLRVAVVAGYSAQVNALVQKVRQTAAQFTNLHVEVNTVDAFQGRDADVCIYSVTRSNARGRLGFQKEVRRLNVALSRGRDALIVVGDDRFCRSVEGDNPFRAVLSHIDNFPVECTLVDHGRLR